MHETKLVNTEFHDNHGFVISGGTNTIYLLDKDGKIDIANVEQIQSEPVKESPKPQAQPHYPRANDYIGVVQWIDEQKQQGIDYFKEAGNNRAQLCRNLTDLFHWVVDSNSLGKQIRNYDFA